MSSKSSYDVFSEELLAKYSDIIDVLKSINGIQHSDVDELTESINKVVTKYNMNYHAIYKIIDDYTELNTKQIDLYWKLLQNIQDEQKIKLNHRIFSPRYMALLSKTYNLGWKLDKYTTESTNEILEVHQRNSLLHLIFNDEVTPFRVKFEMECIDPDMEVAGKRLIEWCALYGSLDCFKFLRSQSAKITNRTYKYSILGRNEEIMKAVESKPDEKCMSFAIKTMNNDLITLFQEKYNLPIVIDSNCYNLAVFLKELIKSDDKSTFYIKSCMFGIPDLTKTIIDAIPTINIRNNDEQGILHRSEYFDKKFVEELIKLGANIEMKDKTGETPLMYCAKMNLTDIADLLINKGAKINEKNNHGLTALMICCKYDNEELANILINHGADVNIVARSWTPLVICCENNSMKVAKLLGAKGVNMNFLSSGNKTPLMICSEHNFVEIAKILIEEGADTQMTNSEGMTALMICRKHNSPEIARLIESNTAGCCRI